MLGFALATKRLTLLILSVCIVGVLAITFLPKACPVELKLVSIDDVGTDLWWVTLSVTNRSTVPLRFKPSTKGQRRIANQWVDADDVFLPSSLGVFRPAVVTFLLPKGTEACRLHLDFCYERQSLKEMLGIGMVQAPTTGAYRIQRFVKRLSPSLFTNIWGTRTSPPTRRLSRQRTIVTPEVILRAHLERNGPGCPYPSALDLSRATPESQGMPWAKELSDLAFSSSRTW